MIKSKTNYIQNGHGKIKAYMNMEYKDDKIHQTIGQKLFKNIEKKGLKLSSLDLFNTKELSEKDGKIFMEIIKTILQEKEKEEKYSYFNDEKQEITKE
jgi:hypothetical protein